MKKLVALFIAAVLTVCLCACSSNPYRSVDDEEFSKRAESGEFGTLVGFYSVKNDNRKDNEMWLQLSVAMEDSPLYSSEGLVVKFMGDKALYDENGKLISEDDLEIGDTLIVSYNLKTYGEDPITIKA
ncbi:MAG: hypothetical protein IJU45_06840, partial [Clostridia bacterium]|nr:hypothetical protein [Clostridia bacterium]